MTTNTYYFQEGGRLTTIEADSYEQSASVGQCETSYTVSATMRWRYQPPFDNRPDFVKTRTRSLLGPLGQLYFDHSGQPSVFWIDTAEGVRQFDRVFNDYLWAWSVEAYSYVRVDGLPDDCSPCTTRFYRNGEVIYSMEECPEISTRPPGCSDCCRQLLPLIRGIRI